MNDNDNSLSPELEQTQDEHINWIRQVTELAAADNWQAVLKAIKDLEPEQLPGMVYALVLARGNDLNEIRRRMAKAADAPLN
jgi:hypothetical protein